MTTLNDWVRGMNAVLVICLSAACSGGGDDAAESGAGSSGGAAGGGAGAAGSDSGGSGGAGGGGEPVASGPPYGPFKVELIAATAAGLMGTPRPARTEVSGFIRDGVEPLKSGWEMIDEVGDCQLFVPDTPLCDPECAVGEICAPGDACMRVPAKQSAGAVTVTGLGEPIALEDKVAGNYTLPTGLTRPYPPCAEGDAITFAVEGNGHDPFMLEVPCVATLDAPEPVTIEGGAPIELRWAAPTMPELANLHAHLEIAHHGGKRGQLECDTTDDGELDIDATLIDGLINLGVSGFPTIVLTRSASMSGSGEASEHVSLTVSASYESPVTIPGVISCTNNSECPDGQSCGMDLRCL